MTYQYFIVILVSFYSLNPAGWVSATLGGQCYSRAQASCQDKWTKLIVAQREGRNNNICSYFGDVHSCTLKYMSDCKLQKEEQELYQRDIVRVYTNKPYSCALIGGNLQYKGEYQDSGARRVKAPEFLFLLPLFTLLKSW